MRQPLAKADPVASSQPRGSKTRQSKKQRDTDYQRRLKLAGFASRDQDGDAVPPDIDAFRYALARRIDIAINSWHGCPEGICRRVRGCMAPNNRCTNAPPPEPGPTGERRAKTAAMIQRALAERLAQDKEKAGK